MVSRRAIVQPRPALVESCRGDAERLAWLERLPALVDDLCREWSLSPGEPFLDVEGSCSWVAPVRRRGGEHAVLKVALPHMEGADEIAGLRYWSGSYTVRLLEADEARSAMLLERCMPGTTLRALPEPEQDAVLGELLPRLWEWSKGDDPRELPFRPLSELMRYWSDETREATDVWPDAGLVRAGLELFDELPASAPVHVVLFTDLHAGNVLRADRVSWLAIDPKPFVGDPAYDATQHLLNCPERMQVSPDTLIATFADRLDVPRERVRAWTFARTAAEPRSRWANDAWFDVARRIAP